MGLYAGIDLGSTTTEFVVLNGDGEIVCAQKELTGGDIQKASETVLNNALKETAARLTDFTYIVSTGYGRKFVPFSHKTVTEITCYAKGVHYLNPDVRTVIDIGGQDSKVISLDADGTVNKFLMNDKCAAGTGRFLEMISNIFNTDIDELGELSLASTHQVKISNICAVFAESEIISLFSRGIKKEDIIASAHRSICERVCGMLKRLDVRDKVLFTGGVANNIGILKMFSECLNTDVIRPANVFTVGALGAAIFARGLGRDLGSDLEKDSERKLEKGLEK